MSGDQLMTAAELSEEIRFPIQTLAYWRCIDKGPEYVKIGRWVRYRRSDVDNWIRANMSGTHREG